VTFWIDEFSGRKTAVSSLWGFGRHVSSPPKALPLLFCTSLSSAIRQIERGPFTVLSAEGGIRPGIYAGYGSRLKLDLCQARSRAL